MELIEWGPEHAEHLAALVAAGLPDEDLSADELLGVCFDPDGVVLATGDGHGAVVVVVRRREGSSSASVALLVVHPDRRREGTGRGLLAAAEDWARRAGAGSMVLGGGAPFYLWPGVESSRGAMVELARDAGYEEAPTAIVDMSLPVSHRADPPAGVVLRRVRTPSDLDAVRALCATHWPRWTAELDRAAGFGTCHGAFAPDGGGEVAVGFACHSVSRAGRVGPMGTAPGQQGRGVGLALLGTVCRDLDLAEFDRAHVSWVGPVAFYARAGGEVCATYRVFSRTLAPAP